MEIDLIDTRKTSNEVDSDSNTNEELLKDVERLGSRQVVLAVGILVILPLAGFVHGLNSALGNDGTIFAFLEGGLGFLVALVWYTKQKLEAKTALVLARTAVKCSR